MSVNPQLIFSVTQIKMAFHNEIGEVRSAVGTGFFLRTEAGTPVFVTNKHNLDPSLMLGPNYTLSSVSILLREYDDTNFTKKTKFVDVDILHSNIIHSQDEDVSAIIAPSFINQPPSFNFYTINRKDNLADQTFFESKVFIMDLVSFLGYPGKGASKWWDLSWNSSIARLGSIASWPHEPFTNPDIKTTDVTLVTGLSFSGSSGSLVMLHEKGIPPGVITDTRYTPEKIIGIMSGHWWESEKEPKMFHHSGLSYYTRSTAIIKLLTDIP